MIESEDARSNELEARLLGLNEEQKVDRRISEMKALLEYKQKYNTKILATDSHGSIASSNTGSNDSDDAEVVIELPRSTNSSDRMMVSNSSPSFNFKKVKDSAIDEQATNSGERRTNESSEKIEWYKQHKLNKQTNQAVDDNLSQESSRKPSNDESPVRMSASDYSMPQTGRNSISPSEESITKIMSLYK